MLNKINIIKTENDTYEATCHLNGGSLRLICADTLNKLFKTILEIKGDKIAECKSRSNN